MDCGQAQISYNRLSVQSFKEMVMDCGQAQISYNLA